MTREKIDRFVHGFLLGSSFVVSAAMTMAFTASLGEGWAWQSVFCAMGLVFEMAKAYAWNRAKKGGWVLLVLAGSLSIFSLAASFLFASVSIEKGIENFAERTFVTQTMESRAKVLLNVANALTKDLDDSTTKSSEGTRLRLATKIQSLSTDAKDAEVQPTVAKSEQEKSTSALIQSFAERHGWDGGLLEAIILGILTTLIELTIAVLSVDRSLDTSSILNAENLGELAKFFRDAVDSEGCLLSRRELVTKGWPERDVRRITKHLLNLGVLEKNGKGKVLTLSEK